MPCRLLQNLGFGGKTLLLSIGLGNGNNTVFWRFKWYGAQPFSDLFPDLFAKESFESFKDSLIFERIQGNGDSRSWLWNWQQQLVDGEVQQLEILKELLMDLTLNDDS
jgi:hypothetical protein